MLNSRLKDTKKKLKEETGKEAKNEKKKVSKSKENRRTSKFAEKYQDRILSIKESDEKAIKRKKAKQAASKKK